MSKPKNPSGRQTQSGIPSGPPSGKPKPRVKPFLTISWKELKGHQIPDLSKIENVEQWAVDRANDTPAQLAADNIVIGFKVRTFKKWFTDHAPLVETFRDLFPNRGPGGIEIEEEDGTSKIYGWNDFCLHFWEVSADWVRKQLKLYHGMAAAPEYNKNEQESNQEQEEEKGEDEAVIRATMSKPELLLEASHLEDQVGSITSELKMLIEKVETATTLEEVKAWVKGLRERKSFQLDEDELNDMVSGAHLTATVRDAQESLQKTATVPEVPLPKPRGIPQIPQPGSEMPEDKEVPAKKKVSKAHNA